MPIPRPSCLLFALIVPVAAQAAPTPLVEAVQKAGTRLKAGGFVVAESLKGETQYNVAGKPAPRSGVPPEKIIFEIGSISKVFTGLLLAQAVIDGKAALTDSIAKHLPADLALDPKVAAITLEQLSTHTSGLPRMPSNFTPANPRDPYADYSAARLHEFLRQYHPEAAPPQPPSYSNLGVGLLGHLLERIYGQSYAELLAAKITRPLGLDDTVIELSEEQRSRFATPFSGGIEGLPWRLASLQGAGGIRSTAADMVAFSRALLAPDSPIHAAWELARQPRADGHIGLGIGIATTEGRTVYSHSGGTGGFRSYLEITPKEDRVTVILLNNDAPEPQAIAFAASHPPPAGAAAAQAEVPIDAVALAAYVGVYQIAPKRTFTALVDPKGHLRIRLSGQPFGPVVHAGDDRFTAQAVGAEFEFARDADGKIDAVTLHQYGRDTPARRTAAPVPTVLFLGGDQLKAYTGTYTLGPSAVFEVSSRVGHLFVKLTGRPTLPVFCDRADHFVYDVVDAALTFERGADGAIAAVVLHQNGADHRAPRVAAAVPPAKPATPPTQPEKTP